MNWKVYRMLPFLDTRAKFIATIPRNGYLLDIGSSDGNTLRHFYEMRPDIKYYATDISGMPEKYPPGCQFYRCDIQKDTLPWEDQTFNAVTVMHLVEHLSNYDNLLATCFRLLRQGGKVYFETPRPKSLVLDSPKGKILGDFTLNFLDDVTHLQIVNIARFARLLKEHGFTVMNYGISRNIMFALLYPFFMFLPASRGKYVSYAHFIGWSNYIIAIK